MDIWYVQHASLWLDIKILVRTPLVMLRGERVDQLALRAARKGFERFVAKNMDSGSHQVRTEQATADGQAARALI